MLSPEIWMDAGYELFARFGPEGLKVERLARRAGISKSSFYHHFADLEVFVGELLALHLRRAAVMAEAESRCASVDPALIGVLLEHRMDLLFSRQLRVARHRPEFAEALGKSIRITAPAFMGVWVRDIGLGQAQLEAFFELAIDNFFLQMTEANLTRPWLEAYFAHLARLARQLG
jgi:AcrR family transcriptional regulator